MCPLRALPFSPGNDDDNNNNNDNDNDDDDYDNNDARLSSQDVGVLKSAWAERRNQVMLVLMMMVMMMIKMIMRMIMMMIMMMMPGLHPPHLPAPRVLARQPGEQPRDGLRP